MLDNFLKPGQRIDIKAVKRAKNTDEETVEKVYSSRIYDFVSDDTLEILMPMEQTKLILLPVDGEYQTYFYTDNGLYECTVRIVDRYKSNNAYLLQVELQTNLTKCQRRDFYRYNCALDMEIRELTDEEKRAHQNGEIYRTPPGLPFRKCVIVDISGGGLRFVTDGVYNKDSMVYCKYDLIVRGELKSYENICKVLSVKEITNRRGEYEHRVQFVNLDNENREEIIQYIFEEERKNRRKERGFM